jgi:hypothetical protein
MDEYIQIGVFMGEDLYGVAWYYTETNQFSIDDDKIVSSVIAYREDNQ